MRSGHLMQLARQSGGRHPQCAYEVRQRQRDQPLRVCREDQFGALNAVAEAFPVGLGAEFRQGRGAVRRTIPTGIMVRTGMTIHAVGIVRAIPMDIVITWSTGTSIDTLERRQLRAPQLGCGDDVLRRLALAQSLVRRLPGDASPPAYIGGARSGLRAPQSSVCAE